MRSKTKCAYCGADITLIRISKNKTALCDFSPILYFPDPDGAITVIDSRGFYAKTSKVAPYTESYKIGQAMGYTLHKTNCKRTGRRK